jgi:GlpG protein
MTQPYGAKDRPDWRGQPWLTWLAMAAAVIVFVGIKLTPLDTTEDPTLRWGFQPAEVLWKGTWWPLLTSPFVHLAVFHIAFNLYWLFLLGSRMEKTVGPLRYLAFFALAAFVSSAAELAFSDQMGIGLSGVVYAIFGFMWPLRERYPEFREVVDDRTLKAFLFWMAICVPLTYLKIMNVANAAHVSGLVFGSLVAYGFGLKPKHLWATLSTVALVGLSFVPLLWMPWSRDWLATAAFEAHQAGRYPEAIRRYTQLIDKDPSNSWALFNRAVAFHRAGDPEKALADLKRARELDPTVTETNE